MKSDYDFSILPPLEHVIEAGHYVLNDAQKMIRRQDGRVAMPRTGLSLHTIKAGKNLWTM